VSVAISRQTNEALMRVMRFFGIDEYNRSLFGDTAQQAGVEAFSKVIEALDRVVGADERSGAGVRIRARIERQKELDRRKNMTKDVKAITTCPEKKL
jgi:hypothetical protein